MTPLTEESVKRAIQEDIDDAWIDDTTEDLFLRAGKLVSIAKKRVVLHGVGAMDCAIEVVGGWWSRHKPPQETRWTFLTNQVHQELGVAITEQIRADAMETAYHRGGS